MMKKKLIIGALPLLLTACADNASGPELGNSTTNSQGAGFQSNDGIDRTALLTSLVDNQILAKLGRGSNPPADSLLAQAQQLDADIKRYCAAIDSATETSALNTAQTQWRNVMGRWQQLQLAEVGPSKLDYYKNPIYGWPSSPISTCFIYSSVYTERANNAFSLNGKLSAMRGLGAIEQVLFPADLNYVCPADSTEKTAWQGLNDTQKKQALCHYADKAAEDLQVSINALVQAWLNPATQADFIADVNGSMQAFVNALFNLETLSKDLKLGTPTGLHNSCSASSCPDAVESALSANSINNIRHNIQGFLAVFTGGAGSALGFDDILAARLNKGLSDEIISRLQALDNRLATFSGSLKDNVTGIREEDCVNSSISPQTTRTVEACALFGDLKAVTDLLKTDFVTLVNVSVPNTAAGDGD